MATSTKSPAASPLLLLRSRSRAHLRHTPAAAPSPIQRWEGIQASTVTGSARRREVGSHPRPVCLGAGQHSHVPVPSFPSLSGT